MYDDFKLKNKYIQIFQRFKGLGATQKLKKTLLDLLARRAGFRVGDHHRNIVSKNALRFALVFRLSSCLTSRAYSLLSSRWCVLDIKSKTDQLAIMMRKQNKNQISLIFFGLAFVFITLFFTIETVAGLYVPRGVEMAHEWTGPVTRG